MTTLDSRRKGAADAAFADHDFGPGLVKDTGGWETIDPRWWERSVFLELPGQRGPSRLVRYYVRFASEWSAVVYRDGIYEDSTDG